MNLYKTLTFLILLLRIKPFIINILPTGLKRHQINPAHEEQGLLSTKNLNREGDLEKSLI